MPAGGSALIAGDVRGCDEQPRQHRAVDDPHVRATPPGLEEGQGDEILDLVDRRGEPVAVAMHPVAVTVEDAPEGLSVARDGAGPVGGVGILLHTL